MVKENTKRTLCLFFLACAHRLVIGLPVRATLNQEIPSIYVEKRQNGGRNAQKALHVPFPLQWGRGMDHLRSSGEQTWKSIWK